MLLGSTDTSVLMLVMLDTVWPRHLISAFVVLYVILRFYTVLESRVVPCQRVLVQPSATKL